MTAKDKRKKQTDKPLIMVYLGFGIINMKIKGIVYRLVISIYINTIYFYL